MKVAFYKHNLNEVDKAACMEVLNSMFLTTGSVVEEFERRFAELMGSPFAIGTNSCTNSLFLCLKYFDIGQGHEVITTAMSFLGTSHAIERTGAKPVYVDVESETGNIDLSLIESAITPYTKAIIPVHLYGQMIDMKQLKRIADRHGLAIIEDACHAIESERDGYRPGMFSDAACFSFYATKNMTAGEGGAIICKQQRMYEWLSKARIQGVNKHAAQRHGKRYQHYELDFLGYKFNMSNIQAALLVNQMDRLAKYLDIKQKISARYEQAFTQTQGVDFPIALPETKHARHIFTIWVNPAIRDTVLDELQTRDVGVAVNYRATHLYRYYREKYQFRRGQLPVTERIGDSTITLPLYSQLLDEEVDYVIEAVRESVKSARELV